MKIILLYFLVWTKLKLKIYFIINDNLNLKIYKLIELEAQIKKYLSKIKKTRGKCINLNLKKPNCDF